MMRLLWVCKLVYLGDTLIFFIFVFTFIKCSYKLLCSQKKTIGSLDIDLLYEEPYSSMLPCLIVSLPQQVKYPPQVIDTQFL